MKLRLLAGAAFTCIATVSAAESTYTDNVETCNSQFVAAVTALDNDVVNVQFNTGLVRTLSAQEKDARVALAVGNALCLQDDAD